MSGRYASRAADAAGSIADEMIVRNVEQQHAHAELIVRIVGCRRDIARRVLHDLGGLSGALVAGELELSRCGLGPLQVGRLRAAGELAREYRAHDERDMEHAYLPIQIYAICKREGLVYLEQEVFSVFSLNVRNQILGCTRVSMGTVRGVEVHPREVFRAAIRLNAAAIVGVHNHPSGDHAPSFEDIELTKRLRSVGAIVGIPIIDHLVISANGFTSIAEGNPSVFE